MIFYGANIGVFSQEHMTATARFEIKSYSEDVFPPAQSLCGPGLHVGLLHYLFKNKYMIKAMAAYAITLHLPGGKRPH